MGIAGRLCFIIGDPGFSATDLQHDDTMRWNAGRVAGGGSAQRAVCPEITYAGAASQADIAPIDGNAGG